MRGTVSVKLHQVAELTAPPQGQFLHTKYTWLHKYIHIPTYITYTRVMSANTARQLPLVDLFLTVMFQSPSTGWSDSCIELVNTPLVVNWRSHCWILFPFPS